MEIIPAVIILVFLFPVLIPIARVLFSLLRLAASAALLLVSVACALAGKAAAGIARAAFWLKTRRAGRSAAFAQADTTEISAGGCRPGGLARPGTDAYERLVAEANRR